jgi:hypothetical protein
MVLNTDSVIITANTHTHRIERTEHRGYLESLGLIIGKVSKKQSVAATRNAEL